MKVKDISVTKSMTVNLGNFQSHRAEVGMSATLDKGEDIDDATEKLAALVNQKLATEITKTMNDLDKNRKTLMEQNIG